MPDALSHARLVFDRSRAALFSSVSFSYFFVRIFRMPARCRRIDCEVGQIGTTLAPLYICFYREGEKPREPCLRWIFLIFGHKSNLLMEKVYTVWSSFFFQVATWRKMVSFSSNICDDSSVGLGSKVNQIWSWWRKINWILVILVRLVILYGERKRSSQC